MVSLDAVPDGGDACDPGLLVPAAAELGRRNGEDSLDDELRNKTSR